MKNKDITEDIIFRCEAGWCEFFVAGVWDWREDKEPLEYFLAIITEPRGLWNRIGKAIQMLYKKEIYNREIILSKEKINELRRVLNKK